MNRFLLLRKLFRIMKKTSKEVQKFEVRNTNFCLSWKSWTTCRVGSLMARTHRLKMVVKRSAIRAARPTTSLFPADNTGVKLAVVSLADLRGAVFKKNQPKKEILNSFLE